MPIVYKTDEHVARCGDQAYDKKRPLIASEMQEKACSDSGRHKCQDHCGSADQGEFYGLDVSSTRREV